MFQIGWNDQLVKVVLNKPCGFDFVGSLLSSWSTSFSWHGHHCCWWFPSYCQHVIVCFFCFSLHYHVISGCCYFGFWWSFFVWPHHLHYHHDHDHYHYHESYSYCWWEKSQTTTCITPCKPWGKLPTSTGDGRISCINSSNHIYRNWHCGSFPDDSGRASLLGQNKSQLFCFHRMMYNVHMYIYGVYLI